MNRSILVLMGTYNGQKYVISQIDSILNQKNVDVKLLIRDDGSKDNTVKIINENYSNDPRIELIEGKNIGCVNCFNILVKEASKKQGFDYFAFSDQDNIWDDTKLISGIELLESTKKSHANSPRVYFCNLMIADCNANPIRPLFKTNIGLKKYNMLVTSKAAGCTIVFNKEMAQVYSEHPAQYPSFHDYWMVLIATFFGDIYFDKKCHIFYRQHSNNAVGLHCLLNWRQRLKNQLLIYFSNDESHFETIKLFYNEFKNRFTYIDNKKFKLLLNYKYSVINKFKILCSLEYYPDCPFFKNPLKYFSFVLKVIFGKL